MNNVPVVFGSNRLNSSGDFRNINPIAKSSYFQEVVLIAGQTLQLALAGNVFYIVATTAAVDIRPRGGTYNSYNLAQGLRVLPENAWGILEVHNPEVITTTFTLFIGFDEFIDNQLVLSSASIAQIVAGIVNVVGVVYGPVANSLNNTSGSLGSFRSFAITLISGTMTINGILVSAAGTIINYPYSGAVFPSPAFDATAGVCYLQGIQ